MSRRVGSARDTEVTKPSAVTRTISPVTLPPVAASRILRNGTRRILGPQHPPVLLPQTRAVEVGPRAAVFPRRLEDIILSFSPRRNRPYCITGERSVLFHAPVPNACKRTYQLVVVQHPQTTVEFGQHDMSRLPLAPPLLVRLVVRNSVGAEVSA